MAIGFILITIAPPFESDAVKVKKYLDSPKSLEGLAADNNCQANAKVEYTHPLFGEYDLISKVEAQDFRALKEYCKKVIQNIPGVINTKMLTGLNSMI